MGHDLRPLVAGRCPLRFQLGQLRFLSRQLGRECLRAGHGHESGDHRLDMVTLARNLPLDRLEARAAPGEELGPWQMPFGRIIRVSTFR